MKISFSILLSAGTLTAPGRLRGGAVRAATSRTTGRRFRGGGHPPRCAHLISQLHPARPGDSVHLAFLQVAAPGARDGYGLGPALAEPPHRRPRRRPRLRIRICLTVRPLRQAGLPLARAIRLALASDTLSISIMEIVDNAIVLAVPGAMDAHVTEPLFWGSLAASLLVTGVAAYPANRWLILRGRGHALVHEHGAHGAHQPPRRRR